MRAWSALMVVVVVAGCDGGWPRETIAENVTGWVKAGVDGSGRIHVVYDVAEFTHGFQYQSRPEGGSWGAVETPVVTDYDDRFLSYVDSVEVDPAGGVHLLFVGEDHRHNYIRRAPGGGWGAVISPLFADFAQLAVAADGSCHIVYQSDEIGPILFHYLPVTSDGAVGAAETALDDRPFPSSHYPFIAVGPDGTVHVLAYSMGIGTLRHFTRSSSGWVEEAEVPLPGPVSLGGVAFEIDGAGGLHLVAHIQQSDLVYLHRPLEGEWSSETVASQSGSASVGNSATMAIDETGAIHLAYARAEAAHVGYESFTTKIYYARRPAAGGSFETELVEHDDVGESISIFLDDGCPHLTYWDRDGERALHASTCL